ncbi:MAG TPA: Stp1/IreP family PP2C-type Ser/Thr phosphatase [Ktedonobacterales bacterium]
MTNQLRLAVAELTDVGRKRERNQDNVLHVVPDTPTELERRGALFVVCDGMGGYAAGEVASDIGVHTIRDEYYKPSDDDALAALARAIREANVAIYSDARDHANHSGMGTTCVAVVFIGPRALFVNIGDSRAYILRDGTLRQVTRDHSWVAEQVRAGILTEEQARHHSQRNVITRSLGPQPEVTADLFIEDMRPGDRVLLCSDGLHGYVAEPEIARVVLEDRPESGVQHLIDLANGNGGPDNITAVVVQVLEVPLSDDTIPLPPTIRIDTAPTIPLPPTAAIAGTGKLSARHAALPATSGASGSRARKRGWPTVAVRLLAVAALLMLAAGIWDVVAGPYAAGLAADQRIGTDLSTARAAAQAASSQNPGTALANLAAARAVLDHDLTTLPADSPRRAQIQQAISEQIAPAVRAVLGAYNRQALITPLPASAVTSYGLSCGTQSLATGAGTLAVAGSGTPATSGQSPTVVRIYALTAQGALYQVLLGQELAICAPTPVATGVKAITTDGPAVYALEQESGHWYVVSIDAGGKAAIRFAVPGNTAHLPVALAAVGTDFYVAYQGVSTQSGGVWRFVGAKPTKPAQTVTTPAGVSALGVAAGNAPFALLTDGSILRLAPAGQAVVDPVALAGPITPVDPSTYQPGSPVPTLPAGAGAITTPAATATSQAATGSIAPAATATHTAAASKTPTHAAPTPTTAPTPLPTPPAPTGAPTFFSGPSSLSADRSAAATIVVGDGTTPRVVRFSVNGLYLQPVQQYFYTSSLAPLESVAVSPDGTRVFAWSGAHLVMITLPAASGG